MSAAPKRGLGRGLGALLGEPRPQPAREAAAPENAIRQIAVGAIVPNPRQPRKTFETGALEDLTNSIRELGVLVPILVRRRDDGYELIAGERRWRAATAAGLTTIPAIVRDADDRASLEVAIVENLQRENLDPLEEAMGFSHLLEEYGLTQDAVAQRVGKSRSAVANALRLLTLPPAIRRAINEGQLSAGHARALLALPEEQREAAAARAIAGGWSVRRLEAFAKEARPAPAAPAVASTVAPASALGEVESQLRYRFGAQVAIVPGATGGRIEIRYADDEDLVRLCDLLLGENP